jgi:DNA-binding winged helix-turn-helix (wHTH) protein
MKYAFANYLFDDQSRRLTLPSGKALRLRPKVAKLLFELLQSPAGRVKTKQELIEAIWEKHSTAGPHDLQTLKRELEAALSNQGLVETVPREGYLFTAKVSTSNEHLLPVVNQISGTLPVYPGLGTAAGALFVHSFVGYGANDYVKHLQKKVRWEFHPRHMVMQSPDIRETILIPFRHTVKSGRESYSWWNVIISVRVDPVSGKWQTVDLTEYQKLAFEVRSSPARAFSQHSFIPIRVRLEDSIDSSETNRQATNWYPHLLKAPKEFEQVEVMLDDYDWSPEAWPTNARSVSRGQIFQIVFGQDATIPSISGVIEIRNVRFLR